MKLSVTIVIWACIHLTFLPQLEKGEIHHEDYNHVLCTMDMLIDVVTIRKHLKDFFPNKAKGNVCSECRLWFLVSACKFPWLFLYACEFSFFLGF